MHAPFKPEPSETIVLCGERYVAQAHPKAQGQVYCAEGGRASVYRLRKKKDGSLYALKVFKERYRDPGLVNVAQSLRQLEGYDGMQAARRTLILPSDKAAQSWTDLQYAMLMPWLDGSTWYDMLVNASRQGRLDGYDTDTAVRLGKRFLEVMERLENAGIAHTDVAPGNVVAKIKPAEDVQLLDLEEMYIPGATPPRTQHPGTPGYSHPTADSVRTTWCPEGDRYAVAVLVSEILILANANLASLASDQGFFAGHRNQPPGPERFKQAHAWLKSIEPDFLRLLEKAWNSNSLEACPRITELHDAIGRRLQVVTQIPGPSDVPFHWDTLPNAPPSVPPSELPQPTPLPSPFVWVRPVEPPPLTRGVFIWAAVVMASAFGVAWNVWFGLASVLAFAALIWNMKLTRVQLFVVLVAAVPLLAAQFAGNPAAARMCAAVLLAWTGLAARVWHRIRR